jgi:rfaE bifunctional protein nucleotidyltransferase chain/domain/rfaE bifunctional protein kinase chain/domain
MKIAVVGDCLLDVDLDGGATRLSPDAPVPVVDVVGARDRAGGAGLVATLLARDGVEVTLVTALAADAAADRIRAALEGVALAEGRLLGPTPVKTRVRADGHAVARLDEGCRERAGCEIDVDRLGVIADADAVVVADYGRGLLEQPRLRAALDAVAARVVWDPHPNGARPVDGVALATPNAAEATIFTGEPVSGVAGAVSAAASLRRTLRARAVGVTLGSRGAVLADGRALPAVLPVTAVEGVDPCGAGDRLAAAAAIALAEGADAHEAMRLGVERAAAFLRAGGVASLVAGPAPVPMRPVADAFGVVAATRAAGGTVVATGGCFDLLHAGHVRTLQSARDLGDCLIVCLNADASVRRLKGPERPIIAAADRVDLLLALACVDAVLVFEEDTPVDALRRLTPDLWVKGGDYRDAEIPEAAVLAEWGGRAVAVPHHPARSSSALAAALAAVG